MSWLFCNLMNCSPPGSSVHGISQARILEWVAISFSRGSSWPRDWTHISCIGRWILYHWVTQEAKIARIESLWRRWVSFVLFHEDVYLFFSFRKTNADSWYPLSNLLLLDWYNAGLIIHFLSMFFNFSPCLFVNKTAHTSL